MKNDIRVLMFVQSVPPLPVGGAEIHTLRLCKRLLEEGIAVTLITPGTNKLKGMTYWDGVPVQCLFSYWNYLLDFLFFIKKKKRDVATKIEYDDLNEVTDAITTPINWGARLRYKIFKYNAQKFLRKHSNATDLIHVMTIEWPGYIASLLGKEFNKKVVLTESTVNGIYNILRYPNGEEKQKLIIGQAHFVAISKAIHHNLVTAGVYENCIDDIYNGISIDNLCKNYTHSGKNVIFVGNLYQQPAKGVDILLKAWQHVISVVPDARLMIVGDGDISAYQKYLDHNNLSGSVQLLGKRSDINELLLQSDVFVLPSRREGMPNALMEAMLRGLPCVATDISGAQDLIENTTSGLLVPPKNVDQLADALIFMLTNPGKAAEMGKEARKVVCHKLDMHNIAKQYAALYKRLIFK